MFHSHALDPPYRRRISFVCHLSQKSSRVAAPKTNGSHSRRGAGGLSNISSITSTEDNSFPDHWTAKTIRLVAPLVVGHEGVRCIGWLPRHLNPLGISLLIRKVRSRVGLRRTHDSRLACSRHVSHVSNCTREREPRFFIALRTKRDTRYGSWDTLRSLRRIIGFDWRKLNEIKICTWKSVINIICFYYWTKFWLLIIYFIEILMCMIAACFTLMAK